MDKLLTYPFSNRVVLKEYNINTPVYQDSGMLETCDAAWPRLCSSHIIHQVVLLAVAGHPSGEWLL